MQQLVLALSLLSWTSGQEGPHNAREVVWQVMHEIEHRRWKEAEPYFTPPATITGVPAEAPEKRWTKSATAYMAEKPTWCFRILHSQLREHDRSATLLVDYRHAHLICRSSFELIKINNQWKIDSVRFATRRNAVGADEQIKKLKGAWQLDPEKNKELMPLIKKWNLKIDRDEFQLDTCIAELKLFGLQPPEEREGSHRDWRIRVFPHGKTWRMELKWGIEDSTAGMLADYSLEGDQLNLNVLYYGAKQETTESNIPKLVFKRMKQ